MTTLRPRSPRHSCSPGGPHSSLGDDRVAYRINHEAAVRARTAGLLVILTQILPRVGHAELWEGRWASAWANLSEGLRIEREIGQRDLVAHQLVLLALIAAHRGAEDECRSLAGESLELSSARGSSSPPSQRTGR